MIITTGVLASLQSRFLQTLELHSSIEDGHDELFGYWMYIMRSEFEMTRRVAKRLAQWLGTA